MALAMIGSGFAWLMLGGGGATSGADDIRLRAASQESYGRPGAPSNPDREGGGLSGVASALGDTASGISEKVRGVAGSATEAAGNAADRVRAATDDASDRASRWGHDTADRGYAAEDDIRDLGERGRRTVLDALDREPLVLGTRFEDETLGKTRDSLVRGAEDVVDRAAETARNVAGEALQAGKEASKSEGLVIEGKAVAERVGEVAKAALSAGKDAAERELKEETPSPAEGSEPRVHS